MVQKKKSELCSVELLNVPHYRQGSFDCLCSYYAGAMMLCTFFPKYELQLGKLKGEYVSRSATHDPFIKYSPHSREDQRLFLAKWFYDGLRIQDVTRILNWRYLSLVDTFN